MSEMNNTRKYYRVAITETLRRVVTVAAEDEDDARQRVSDAWRNTEYILEADDFEGVEFYTLGEGEAPSEEEKGKEEKPSGMADSMEVDTDE